MQSEWRDAVRAQLQDEPRTCPDGAQRSTPTMGNVRRRSVLENTSNYCGKSHNLIVFIARGLLAAVWFVPITLFVAVIL